ncbi:hypothetical protein [Clavibacter sp. km1a]|uniref:hypothetical protein n=1 Tax=Clavibacter sp. km1a TaxID=3459136 RepID=UPI0040434F06
MQLIHYSDDTYATGDEIAYAVIRYAEALALVESSATVGIPFRRADATVGHLEMLVGPASQIVLESSPDTTDDELRDADLVASITERTLLLSTDQCTSIDIDDQSDATSAVPDEL